MTLRKEEIDDKNNKLDLVIKIEHAMRHMWLAGKLQKILQVNHSQHEKQSSNQDKKRKKREDDQVKVYQPISLERKIVGQIPLCSSI